MVSTAHRYHMETVQDIEDNALVSAASRHPMGMLKYQASNALVSAVCRYRMRMLKYQASNALVSTVRRYILGRNVKESKSYWRPAHREHPLSTTVIKVSNARPAKVFRKVLAALRYEKSRGQPNATKTSILKEYQLRETECHVLSAWYR